MNRDLKILWLMPPSRKRGELPLVSQNRWFKYMPTKTNMIYPVLASYGVSMLKEHGFDVDFCDAPAEDIGMSELLTSIRVYDLVILECRTPVMPWRFDTAKILKAEHPRLKVAGYGDHVMIRAQEALEHGFDYVIDCGDWDWGALMLAREISSGDWVDPIFSWPRLTDLEELPLLDREAVPWKNYRETWRHREEFGWVQSGRGCFGKCTYCSWNYTYYQCHMRTMSSKAAFAEMEHAARKYQIKEFLDDADTFVLNPLGVELATKILEEQLDVYWNIQTRADLVAATSVEDLKLMANSGLHVVKLGVDGGHNSTLQRIQKGHTVEHVRDAVRKMKEAGLEIHINLILGWPWETKKEAYDTVKFVRDLKPNQAQFSLIQPFIGTPLYTEAMSEGWFCIDPGDYTAWNMKGPILSGEMNSQEIRELYKYAWSSFYFSPSYVTRQLFKASRLALKEHNLDAFKHLWRGFKGVYSGHLKAVD
jgi:radical SAM superfamily enzyme YgiQ (UPF0313 family)